MKINVWIFFMIIAFCVPGVFGQDNPPQTPPPSCKVGKHGLEGKHPPCSPFPSSKKQSSTEKKETK